MQIVLSSFSSHPLALLQAPKSLLLRLQPREQDHGIFPIGILLGLAMIWAALYFSSPYRSLPPGPRGYPIIGSLLELRSEQWVKFAQWRKQYGPFSISFHPPLAYSETQRIEPGDIIYLNVVGQPMVVLNSHKVAGDLLDRRSRIYSDRPRNIVGCDIMTGGLLFALSHFGDV